MQNQAPTSNNVMLINWAGGPLAEWVASKPQGRLVNFWASEDKGWVYFQRFCPVYGSQES